MCTDALRITSPWSGDILNRHDGEETEESLTIAVEGAARPGAAVQVNGVETRADDDGRFACRVSITERRTRLTARSGDASDSVVVLWDKASFPRYRFSVDDNIEFLKDLGTRPDDYPSLFDHWYLAFWRRMHEEFGAKIHINIYFQTVERDFTLEQMPDKWKDEWIANSEWLHLSFHALQNLPNRIYKDATPERVGRDYDLVVEQIKRFASDAVLTSETTVHWAEAPKDACRALRARGIDRLIGIFRKRRPDQIITTGYYLDAATCEHIAGRDYWYDEETDLLFIDCDQVVNSYPLDQIVPCLEQQAANPHTAELIELLIHEQYFREEMEIYQPDIQDKVRAALTWVTERGYRPVFWSEGFAGNLG